LHRALPISLPAVTQEGENRHGACFGLVLAERRGLRERAPDRERSDHEDAAEQERDSPSPAEEGLTGKELDEAEHAGRDEEPGGRAHLVEAPHQAALAGRSVLECDERAAAEFAADAEALDEPRGEEQG